MLEEMTNAIKIVAIILCFILGIKNISGFHNALTHLFYQKHNIENQKPPNFEEIIRDDIQGDIRKNIAKDMEKEWLEMRENLSKTLVKTSTRDIFVNGVEIVLKALLITLCW